MRTLENGHQVYAELLRFQHCVMVGSYTLLL